MDYIREFDIKLEKEMFYAGEMLSGFVVLDTVENFKLRGNFLQKGKRKIAKLLFYFIKNGSLTLFSDSSGAEGQSAYGVEGHG